MIKVLSYDTIMQLAQAVASANKLDLAEEGLIGIAYWCRYNNSEDVADAISDFIWDELYKISIQDI